MAKRSEDRLDDDVAHGADGGHCVFHTLADNGLWHEQARVVQQRRRIELVNRSFDRARRIDDTQATILQPVQRVDAVDQLFERAARDDARENGVGVEDGNLFAGQTRLYSDTCDEAFVGQDCSEVAARGQGANQFVGMPAGARAQDHDAHLQPPKSDARRTSTFVRPA